MIAQYDVWIMAGMFFLAVCAAYLLLIKIENRRHTPARRSNEPSGPRGYVWFEHRRDRRSTEPDPERVIVYGELEREQRKIKKLRIIK